MGLGCMRERYSLALRVLRQKLSRRICRIWGCSFGPWADRMCPLIKFPYAQRVCRRCGRVEYDREVVWAFLYEEIMRKWRPIGKG